MNCVIVCLKRNNCSFKDIHIGPFGAKAGTKSVTKNGTSLKSGMCEDWWRNLPAYKIFPSVLGTPRRESWWQILKRGEFLLYFDTKLIVKHAYLGSSQSDRRKKSFDRLSTNQIAGFGHLHIQNGITESTSGSLPLAKWFGNIQCP